MQELRDSWNEISLSTLTPRERQVLRAMAEGKSTMKIAEELEISRLTVQGHVKSILVKLGVHTKVEAVVMAVRQELGSAAPDR